MLTHRPYMLPGHQLFYSVHNTIFAALSGDTDIAGFGNLAIMPIDLQAVLLRVRLVGQFQQQSCLSGSNLLLTNRLILLTSSDQQQCKYQCHSATHPGTKPPFRQPSSRQAALSVDRHPPERFDHPCHTSPRRYQATCHCRSY